MGLWDFLSSYSFEEQGKTSFPDSLCLSETEAAVKEGVKVTALGLGSGDMGGACWVDP